MITELNLTKIQRWRRNDLLVCSTYFSFIPKTYFSMVRALLIFRCFHTFENLLTGFISMSQTNNHKKVCNEHVLKSIILTKSLIFVISTDNIINVHIFLFL